ncbi:MAG: hypothetical protein QOE84_3182 [Actinomycetota bacterium]|nr:hypothetical protein [Actinomycetota bacterium]
MKAVGLGVVALALAISGCGAGSNSDHSANDASVTVSGTMLMTGGPTGAQDTAAPGDVTLDGGGTHQVVTTSADGTFTTTLPSGTYRATGSAALFGDGMGVCRALNEVVVADASVTGIVVACTRR